MTDPTDGAPSTTTNRYPCQGCRGQHRKCAIHMYVDGCINGRCSLGHQFQHIACKYMSSKGMKSLDINEELLEKVIAKCNLWSVNSGIQTPNVSIINVGDSIERCGECRANGKPCIVMVSCEYCLKKLGGDAEVKKCVADKQLERFIAFLVRKALAATASRLPDQPHSDPAPRGDRRDQAPRKNTHVPPPSGSRDTRHRNAMSHFPEPPPPHAGANHGPFQLSIDTSVMGSDRYEPPITTGTLMGSRFPVPASTSFQAHRENVPSLTGATNQPSQQGILPAPYAQTHSVLINDGAVPNIVVVEALDVNPLALLNRRDHTVVVDFATPSTFLTCDGTLAPETPETPDTVLMGASLDRNQYKPMCVHGSMTQAWFNGVGTAPPNTPNGYEYSLNQYRLNGYPRQTEMRTLEENYEVCRERQSTMLINHLGTSAAFIPPDDIRRKDVLVETSPPHSSHGMFMLQVSANNVTQAHNTATIPILKKTQFYTQFPSQSHLIPHHSKHGLFEADIRSSALSNLPFFAIKLSSKQVGVTCLGVWGFLSKRTAPSFG